MFYFAFLEGELSENVTSHHKKTAVSILYKSAKKYIYEKLCWFSPFKNLAV